MGRVVAVTSAGGAVQRFAYRGNHTWILNPAGKRKRTVRLSDSRHKAKRNSIALGHPTYDGHSDASSAQCSRNLRIHLDARDIQEWRVPAAHVYPGWAARQSRRPWHCVGTARTDGKVRAVYLHKGTRPDRSAAVRSIDHASRTDRRGESWLQTQAIRHERLQPSMPIVRDDQIRSAVSGSIVHVFAGIHVYANPVCPSKSGRISRRSPLSSGVFTTARRTTLPWARASCTGKKRPPRPDRSCCLTGEYHAPPFSTQVAC